MKAIRTKNLPMTETKPLRIKATDNDGNSYLTSPLPHEDNSDTHKRAAFELCNRMKWGCTYVMGALDGGYVFVNIVGAESFQVTW